MLRILIGSLGTLALSATVASACDFHGGGYGGYDGYGVPSRVPTDAAMLLPTEDDLKAQEAAREQAMQSARASFLTRFAVKVEAAPSAVDEPKLVQASLTDDNADRSSRSVAQDR